MEMCNGNTKCIPRCDPNLNFKEQYGPCTIGNFVKVQKYACNLRRFFSALAVQVQCKTSLYNEMVIN